MRKAFGQLVVFLLAVITAWSCSSNSDELLGAGTDTSYFSIESYFTDEAARLQAQSPQVRKMVVKSGESEERVVSIRSWANELDLFILSDINMDAWKGKYKVDSAGSQVTYRAIDPELRTQQIAIQRGNDGAIRHIHISNASENMLYKSIETLDYYPDSLYIIEKQQDIRWWSDNTYKIIGHIVAQ